MLPQKIQCHIAVIKSVFFPDKKTFRQPGNAIFLCLLYHIFYIESSHRGYNRAGNFLGLILLHIPAEAEITVPASPLRAVPLQGIQPWVKMFPLHAFKITVIIIFCLIINQKLTETFLPQFIQEPDCRRVKTGACRGGTAIAINKPLSTQPAFTLPFH